MGADSKGRGGAGSKTRPGGRGVRAGAGAEEDEAITPGEGRGRGRGRGGPRRPGMDRSPTRPSNMSQREESKQDSQEKINQSPTPDGSQVGAPITAT